MKTIDLDANATTPMLPAVWEAMRPYAVETYGNPASGHRLGASARRAVEDARERIASILRAAADEVIFTSGGTEANNLAVFGLMDRPAGRVLTTAIEHPSTAEPIRQLAANGCAIDELPVDAQGVVTLPQDGIRADTGLIAVMLVNHETGAIQPVRELTEAAGPDIPFHCDAVQAVGKMPVHFHELGVSSFALSAHKFHGPKGAGALLVRRGVELRPRFHGGHQQQERRPGTEPVHLIVGLATALDISQREMAGRLRKVQQLRSLFLERLRARTECILNGPDGASGSPNTLNLSFPGCQADSLFMKLDLAGVACSTGSACSSGSLRPSPVLAAMGIAGERLRSAMRFSFSSLLTEPEVIEAVDRIAAAVSGLRRLNEPEIATASR
jgi:cysteine desulfurase